MHAQVFLLLHLCVHQFISNACGLVQEIIENVYDKNLQDFILNTYLRLLKTQIQTKCLFYEQLSKCLFYEQLSHVCLSRFTHAEQNVRQQNRQPQ